MGGLADPADASEMADGLQRYLDEGLSMACEQDGDELDEAERSDLRKKIIPFLRSDGFAVMA